MNGKSDFTADVRLVWIAALAIPSASSAIVAVLLQRLISFFTNVFYYQRLVVPDQLLAPQQTLPAGCRGPDFGPGGRRSPHRLDGPLRLERIRGHGIPEAMEAILIGQSRMSPQVAVLKPLSSAISIGSGGPFKRGGPIIMTGGARRLSSSPRFSTYVGGERRRCSSPGPRAAWRRRSVLRLPQCCWPSSCCCSSGSRGGLVPVAVASATAALMRWFSSRMRC